MVLVARIRLSLRCAMDSDALIRAVASLSQEATSEANAEVLLRRLCGAARIAMTVDGAGVMLSDERGNTFVHALPVVVEPLDLQEALRDGPCVEAALSGAAVVVDHPEQLDRWPELATVAARMGIAAVLVVPLMSRGTCWGVLDLYRFAPGPWRSRDQHVAQILADISAPFLVMGADRALTRHAHEELMRLSRNDSLTGLPNRVVLFEQLDRALVDAKVANSTFAVVFIDLDRFKSINDTFGHGAGDLILERVADRLAGALRVPDSLARLGGDEFVYISGDSQPGATSPLAFVGSVVQRLRQVFDAPFRLGEVDVAISASMGVTITDGNSAAREVLADADHAMYAAKRQGRGSIVVQDHTHTSHTRQLQRDPGDALPNQELAVHYQPIVTADDPARIVAVEALRWTRADGSILPAAAFIDTAESIGLIVGTSATY